MNLDINRLKGDSSPAHRVTVKTVMTKTNNLRIQECFMLFFKVVEACTTGHFKRSLMYVNVAFHSGDFTTGSGKGKLGTE